MKEILEDLSWFGHLLVLPGSWQELSQMELDVQNLISQEFMLGSLNILTGLTKILEESSAESECMCFMMT